MNIPVPTKYARLGPYHWRGLDRSWSGLAGPFSLFDHSRYEMILGALGPAPRRVLEVGCGDGALSHRMALAGHRVCGVDLDPVAVGLALEQTQRRAYAVRPRFLRADLMRESPAPGRFDRIVLADVLEHLEDQAGFVRRLVGMLVPGGRIVLTTPARREEGPWDAAHTREFDKGELEAFLAGFEGRAEVRAWLPQAAFSLYRRRWGRAALNLASLGSNPFSWPVRGRAVMLFASFEPAG